MIKTIWVLRSLLNLIHTEVAQPEQEGSNPYLKDYAEMRQRKAVFLLHQPWLCVFPGQVSQVKIWWKICVTKTSLTSLQLSKTHHELKYWAWNCRQYMTTHFKKESPETEKFQFFSSSLTFFSHFSLISVHRNVNVCVCELHL